MNMATEASSNVSDVLEKASDGISIAEAAERIGVHPQTIRNWIREGLLPATVFGKRMIKIDPADLDKLRRAAGPADAQHP